MNKAKILSIAEACFIKNPYDPPEKIIELCVKFVECVEEFARTHADPAKLPSLDLEKLYTGETQPAKEMDHP